MSPILPSLLRLLINFVLNSPILENRWSTKFQQLFTICHILTKRKLSYYLFFLHPTIKEQMLNIQNIPRWKSSWFRRDKYELTIKQCFTSICPWQYQNCQSNTRLQKGSKLFTSSYRPISIWPCFSKFSDLIDEYYIQPVWQWLTCSKIILGLLMIKNSLLEVSSTCPKHLTLCPRNSFWKAVPLWHTQSCLRLGEKLFQR